jgi:hypothetical protein
VTFLAACRTLKGIHLNEKNLKIYRAQVKKVDDIKTILKANREKCLQEDRHEDEHEG